MGELAESFVTGDVVFDPFTGVALADAPSPHWSPSARAGLEAPRFCQVCGRRMVVRINPMGWVATCSRHGELDSALAERHAVR